MHFLSLLQPSVAQRDTSPARVHSVTGRGGGRRQANEGSCILVERLGVRTVVLIHRRLKLCCFLGALGGGVGWNR